MRASTTKPDLKLETWNLKPARQPSSRFPNRSSHVPNCSSPPQLEPFAFRLIRATPSRQTHYKIAPHKTVSNLSARQ